MRIPSTAWVWLLALSIALRSLVPWVHAQPQATDHPLLAAFCGSNAVLLQQQALALAGELLEEPDNRANSPCLGCVQAQAAALPTMPGPRIRVAEAEHYAAPSRTRLVVQAHPRHYAIRAPPFVLS